VPDLGDTQAELRLAVERGLPADGPSYVGLIGGLIEEQDRHPVLIDGSAGTSWSHAERSCGSSSVARLVATSALTSIRRKAST
jgi:hypothetical protein